MLHRMESFTLCKPIVSNSHYIRVNDKELIHSDFACGSSADGSSSSSSTSCGAKIMAFITMICSALFYIITQVFNLFMAVLFIMGCPMDRINACCTSVSSNISSVTSSFSSLFSSSSSSSLSPSSSRGYILGGSTSTSTSTYAPLNTQMPEDQTDDSSIGTKTKEGLPTAYAV